MAKDTLDAVSARSLQVVGDEPIPLGKIKDFAPYITKIMASGAEVVMTGDWGQDLKLFLQQGAALGCKGALFRDAARALRGLDVQLVRGGRRSAA